MIKPVNGHLLIEPLEENKFITSQKSTFEEIGIVVDFDDSFGDKTTDLLRKGDKVFFDSWLIARYPDGKDGELWLVRWEDVRAIERNENQVSE